jgi:hypothetical protein
MLDASQLDYLEHRENHRSALIRRAILLTPTAIAITSLLLYSLSYQAWVPAFVLALCTFAVDYEAFSTLRDLRAEPTTTQGRIDRLWKKSRYLFIGRVDYMLIARLLFEISANSAAELRPGDEVVVEHWPHTTMVISLARARDVRPSR